jgi:protein phosphatase 1B
MKYLCITLLQLLKNRVTELVKESDGNIELPHILQTLSDENISDLPPGGGLAAKRSFIESVYKVLCPNSVDSVSNKDFKQTSTLLACCL